MRAAYLWAMTHILLLSVVQVASGQEACLELPGIDDKCEAWVANTGFGEACCDFLRNTAARNIVATSSRVFYAVPMNDPGRPSLDERYDFQTVALDPATGAELWKRRYDGPAAAWDIPHSVAIAPDQSVVYVTGYRDFPRTPNSINFGGCGQDFMPASELTNAYRASDGAELWRFDQQKSPAALDAAFSSVVSPDGSILYTVGLVAIAEEPQHCDHDLGITAIDTASGNRLWGATLSGSGNSFDAGYAAAVTPDGSRLIVGGVLTSLSSDTDFLTLALDAVDDEDDLDDRAGEVIWQKVDSNPGADLIKSMALSPDGKRVFISGDAAQPGTTLFPNTTYATLAYDVADGRRLWRSLYTTPIDGPNTVLGLAVSPIGGRVFVTGQIVESAEVSWDYGTIAYDATTGGELWAKRYRDPVTAFEEAADVLVSTDGSRLFVTGHSGHPSGQGDAATVAYSTADGSELWIGRLNGSMAGTDYTEGLKLALSPDGSKLFALGMTGPTGEAVVAAASGQPPDYTRGLVWAYDTSG